jgi:hypothetical protein
MSCGGELDGAYLIVSRSPQSKAAGRGNRYGKRPHGFEQPGIGSAQPWRRLDRIGFDDVSEIGDCDEGATREERRVEFMAENPL